MSDQTQSANTSTDQARVNSVLYKLRAPMHQTAAAIFGARMGLLTADDLPEVVAEDCTQAEYDAYRVALDKVLRGSGAMAGHLEDLAAGAVPADCPWWCDGKHPEIQGRIMGDPPHATDVCRVDFDSARPSVTVVISACAGDLPRIYADELDTDSHGYDAEDARTAAEALVMAADRLDQITAASA